MLVMSIFGKTHKAMLPMPGGRALCLGARAVYVRVRSGIEGSGTVDKVHWAEYGLVRSRFAQCLGVMVQNWYVENLASLKAFVYRLL